MIYVNRYTIESVASDSEENGYDEALLVKDQTDCMSFRELVAELENYPHPSSSHVAVTASVNVWAYSLENDMYTGAMLKHSIHYARENHPRMAKYWVKALRYVFG